MRGVHILLFALTVALSSTRESDGAKILALFNLNGRSHFVMFESLLKGLAERGHQVHVVGHFPQKKPIPNYNDISVEGSLPGLVNNFTIDVARNLRDWTLYDFIWRITRDMCETVLQQPQVQKLISHNDNYDLIISEVFGPDCFLGLAYKYKVPVIGMTSSVMFPWANDRIANPDNPAYIPNYFVPFTAEMTLIQRLKNLLLNEALKLGDYYFGELPMDELGKKYYGAEIPPLSVLKKNMSMIFVNSHYSLNIPRPAVPAFLEVGGIHIRTGGKLPKDIEAYMDEAQHGVIYFSLGSLVRGETLPKETIQIFVNVFSKMPQRVLWKIDDIGALPSNIKTSKWLPQFEILSHPNTKAFISHGGLMGVQESVYAGVPLVGIPLFADQELNIRNCMSKGMAVLVHYDAITEEAITNALDSVLNDPSYGEKAKHLSTLFKDRPQTPLEAAIYWTEYVIRHRGAPHLQSAAVHLPIFQYLLLDVIAAITLLLIIACAIPLLIIRKLFVLLCGSKKQKLKTK